MNDFLLDLRLAVRRLAKAPGYAGLTLLMLSLGIGVSVSMFSILSGDRPFRPAVSRG